jgi:hypothetical protein
MECHLNPIILHAPILPLIEDSPLLVQVIAQRYKIVVSQIIHVLAMDAWVVRVHIFPLIIAFSHHHVWEIFSLAEDIIAIDVDDDHIHKLIALIGGFGCLNQS